MHFEFEAHPEVAESETGALALIPSGKQNSPEFAWHFESALHSCFRSLPKGNPLRGWDVDDFSFVSVKQSSKKLSLEGPANWLNGGDGAGYVNLDIALNTSPILLYSYKFRRKLGAPQSLYVGRTFSGWVVSDGSR